MKIFVKKKDGLELPVQAHPGEDMGYDVKTMSEPTIVGEPVCELDGRVTRWHSVDYIEYNTELQICPQFGAIGEEWMIKEEGMLHSSTGLLLQTHILVFPRSSVTKYNLILKNCIPVIDNPYRGNILLRFAYQWQPQNLALYGNVIVGKINEDKIYKKGDKIAQLCPFNPYSAEYEFVDELPNSIRQENGFGSSGR